MGNPISKDFLGMNKRKIDEACSNTSLSKIRYVAVEKPKWKVFGKRDLCSLGKDDGPKKTQARRKGLRPLQTYQMRSGKGCPCGANGLCRQTVTPRGVTIHYPQKKRFEKRYKPPKIDKAFLGDKERPANNVKIIRPKKFGVVPAISTPIWRMDSNLSPFHKLSRRRRRRTSIRPNLNEESGSEDEDGASNQEKSPSS